MTATLALAFGAGLVATVNPCGFAMLPAYLSYFVGLGGEEHVSRATTLRRALVVGSVMSGAFLLVFGVTGIAISAGFRVIIDWIPWVALVVGAAVAVLGIAMLRGYVLNVSLPKPGSAGKGRGLRSVFLFGLSYAAASLSCTLPVFLSVVATQLTSTSFVSGVALFVAYGLGMSLVMLSITIGMALGKQSLVKWLRGAARYVNRVAGAILVLAGSYILWFWGTNLTSGADSLGDAGAFGFVESLSQRAIGVFGENPEIWGLVFGGIVVAAIVFVLLQPSEAPVDSAGPPDGKVGADR